MTNPTSLTTRSRQGRRWLHAGAAMVIILLLAGGVPWLLSATVGNPTPHDGWSWSQPLTDQAILGLVAVLAWLFWAQFMVCLVVEIVAEIRIAAGRSADWMSRVPATFTGQQQLARVLVQAVVAVGIGTTTLTPVGNQLHHDAAASLLQPAADVRPPASAQSRTIPATSPTARIDNAHDDVLNGADDGAAGHQTSSDIGSETGKHHAGGDSIGRQRHPASTRTVQVARGDTLWSLAERYLGAGEQWRRIADLNHGRQMTDGEVFTHASSILPGWRLLVPAPEPTSIPSPGRFGRVSVEPGDTLWGLAADAYGDGEAWPRIYRANRETVPDPDLILPGQVLDIPADNTEPGNVGSASHDARHPGDGHPPIQPTAPTAPAAPAAPTGPTAARPRTQPVHPPAEPPRRELHPPPTGEHTDGAYVPPPDPVGSPRADRNPHPHGPTPAVTNTDASTLGVVLLGGGSLLAAGLLAGFLARRRVQARARRSGRTIASTPVELVDVERTLRQSGSTGAAAAAFLDGALRELADRVAAAGLPLPEVAAARLDADRLDLLFATPADGPAPAPWEAGEDGARWSRPRQVEPADSGRLAPYPTLVAIGVDDRGATWLVDLEAARLLHLSGDPVARAGLARFIGGELAVNAWSDDVEVTLTGFAPELIGLNPNRLRYEDDLDIERLVKARRRAGEAAAALGYDAQDPEGGGLGGGSAVLAGRLDGAGADTWMPTVTIATLPGGGPDSAQAAAMREAITGFAEATPAQSGRDTVALVTVGDQTAPEQALVLSIDSDRSITLPAWGVRVTANQLTASDAQALVDLLSSADRLDDEPIPPDGEAPLHGEVGDTVGAGGVHDAAGAIRAQLTEPRGDHPGAASMLPGPDQRYLDAAATTPADLAALAPKVAAETRSRLLSRDPGLDADLSAWYEPSTTRPRLRVLGPVEVRAGGERTAEVDRRLAYYTEVVAYLACREHGAPPEQLADAFGVQTNTIHSRIGTVRKWLGTNPETDDWYLPESTLSPAAKARGVPVYQLVGHLVDADLFKRLRLRGQAAGADGIDDLIAALRLVAGEPFDQQRPGGYGWLADTALDQYLAAGIVDVAHLLATHALEAGDGQLALWASQQAITAAPSEDKPRLDFARALEALGRAEEARRYLRRDVVNRSDDDAPPPPLSRRTTDLIEEIRRRGDTA